MAAVMMEESMAKTDQSYVELRTCSSENVSPYSTGSDYSDQSSYCQTDYDWHQQQQTHPHYHHHHDQQQQQHHQHHSSIQTPQLTDLSQRQYYPSYHETHEIAPAAVGSYPAFSHHTLQQNDFYNPVLWPSGQSDYIQTTPLSSSTRLFSGIDMSQHIPSIPPNGTQLTPQPSIKPKRKRVQSHNQRKAANVRERKRMFHLNEAFDSLRKRLPAFNYEKRLSRIETLRLAMTYISFMKDVSVGEDPKCVKLKPHGLDLSPSDPLHALAAAGHDFSFSSGSDSHKLSSSSPINDYSDSCSGDELKIHDAVH